MYEIEKIDFLANAGKCLFELLSMPRSEKDAFQSAIDLGAELLKLVNSIEKAKLEQFQASADRFGLERVILFPYPTQGGWLPLFRIYGGDIPSFCHAVGIQLLTENDTATVSGCTKKLEERYGIPIYMRNNDCV